MSPSTSLLAGAKLVAEAAKLEWAEVHKFYRDLQTEPSFVRGEQVGPDQWLPKSLGRNIWPAHPHFIARLLIALAASGEASGAREAVQWAAGLTRGGRETGFPSEQSPLELALARLLTDKAESATVEAVEFRMDVREVVIIRRRSGQTVTFSDTAGPTAPRGINWRGIIPSSVFQALNNTISWLSPGDPPLEKVPDDTVDLEA